MLRCGMVRMGAAVVCTGSDGWLSVSLLTWSCVQSDIDVEEAQHSEGPLWHLVYLLYIGARGTND